MSKREPKLLLLDILASIEKIQLYTSEHTFDTFLEDSKTRDAVIRNFEIIGEAANRLPEEFKDSNEGINWFRIRGFRNRIVHDYMGIDFQIVWTIIDKDLKKLAEDIQAIVDEI
ncbi:HepT-like ribonuclease domain-containing protein [Aquirufa nivalisilvae]